MNGILLRGNNANAVEYNFVSSEARAVKKRPYIQIVLRPKNGVVPPLFPTVTPQPNQPTNTPVPQPTNTPVQPTNTSVPQVTNTPVPVGGYGNQQPIYQFTCIGK